MFCQRRKIFNFLGGLTSSAHLYLSYSSVLIFHSLLHFFLFLSLFNLHKISLSICVSLSLSISFFCSLSSFLSLCLILILFLFLFLCVPLFLSHCFSFFSNISNSLAFNINLTHLSIII